jgi:hypothetical protein
VGFDALGGDAQTEGAGQGDHALDDRLILFVAVESRDEAAVHLQRIHWTALQRSERRIARPEIVHRQANAKSMQRIQDLGRCHHRRS